MSDSLYSKNKVELPFRMNMTEATQCQAHLIFQDKGSAIKGWFAVTVEILLRQTYPNAQLTHNSSSMDLCLFPW